MLKHLHYDHMLVSIEEWCKKKLNYTPRNTITLIMKSLLKLFIKNSVKLISLFIIPNCDHYGLNRYIELVEPEFNGLIKDLKYLHVETHSHYPSANFFQKFSLIVRNMVSFYYARLLLILINIDKFYYGIYKVNIDKFFFFF